MANFLTNRVPVGSSGRTPFHGAVITMLKTRPLHHIQTLIVCILSKQYNYLAHVSVQRNILRYSIFKFWYVSVLTIGKMKYVQHIKTKVTYRCWSRWLTWYNDTEAFKIYIMLNFPTGFELINYLSMVLGHFREETSVLFVFLGVHL